MLYFQNLQAKLGQRVLKKSISHGEKDARNMEIQKCLFKLTKEANDYVTKI